MSSWLVLVSLDQHLSWGCPSVVVRGDAHGKLTYLKYKSEILIKLIYDGCHRQFSRQVSPADFCSASLTSLTIQPVELCSNVGFDESFVYRDHLT